MNEFTEYHSTLVDEDLIRIAYFEKGKMKKEARISAKNILKQRGLSKNKTENLKNEIRKRKRKERNQKLRDKNNNYGILDFILDIFF